MDATFHLSEEINKYYLSIMNNQIVAANLSHSLVGMLNDLSVQENDDLTKVLKKVTDCQKDNDEFSAAESDLQISQNSWGMLEDANNDNISFVNSGIESLSSNAKGLLEFNSATVLSIKTSLSNLLKSGY